MMMVVVGKTARLRTGCAAVYLSYPIPSRASRTLSHQSTSSSISTERSTICNIHRALTRHEVDIGCFAVQICS